ncbi:Alpha/Beta hydrolase protein [Delphinella strobiligena]|nr:Alpha/Beta hydrolase protein [Delphinella strobiligena]
MSAIDQLPSFGRSIFVALLPTIKAYGQLHEKNRTAIESTPIEEFEYGPDDRQKLDLYTPENLSDDAPILVFVYGGGFSRGDKRAASLPGEPTSLVYHNLGHYWTSRGFITVIPDYRRTGEGARFPSGGEDIADAVAWIKNRFGGGNHKLYLMGNSAGAVHTATWLLELKLVESRKSDCATGLIDKTEEAPKVKTLIVMGTLDPDDEIIEPSDDLVKRWRGRFGDDKLSVSVLDGHNHFSPVFALGTGIDREETLGTEVLRWMKQ